MTLRFQKVTLPAVMGLIAFAGAARAQDSVCSNGTLRGDFAFTVSATILNADGTTTSRIGVALAHFDGQGNLTQTDYVMNITPGHTPPGGIDTNPAFRTGETGTYTVNSDCTGTAEIDFPPHPGGAVIKLVFVIGSHGQTIHTVVSSLTPPGASAPIPVLIRSDAEKLGAEPSIANPDE